MIFYTYLAAIAINYHGVSTSTGAIGSLIYFLPAYFMESLCIHKIFMVYLLRVRLFDWNKVVLAARLDL